MKLSIPGKTFLVGEYSVLLGASALGIATRPCFEIEYGDTQLQIHPESPAGLYLNKYSKTLSASLFDPYPLKGAKGGFGKSTAEYFAAIFPDLLNQKKHFSDILKEYRELHTQTIKPSGIDLAFQYFGHICLADPAIKFYQNFGWHFANLDFYILSTGLKIATHEHLKSLNLESLKELPKLSDKITQVFAENREFEFLALMKEWCELLNKHGLTHPNTLDLKKKLESFNPIKLAKPCGALGADVIIVFFASSQKEQVYQYLIENKFSIQAHSSDLAPGVLAQLEQQGS